MESTWAWNDWLAEVYVFDILPGKTQMEVYHV